mmetsp:Transcript_10449/g.15270  ORF Transcript_10449/g.15270 Transcript_10449/m.15270 type:complete len:350 (+) Transcript_10449:21-1070(+)
MLMILLKLFGNLVALIIGAWCVSEGGDILGDKYDATVIGGFVIAWLNTLPEAIFFITALNAENHRFAVGAISGSVIVVNTIAVGLCVYIGAKARSSSRITLQKGVRYQALILLASCVIVLLTIMFGFNLFVGILGCIFYVAFMGYTLYADHSEKKSETLDLMDDKELIDVRHESEDESDDEEEQPTWKGMAFLIAGGLIIYLFSLPFIDAVVEMGELLSIGSLALAFFFAPVASEAPEILESISLSRKGKLQNINIAFSNLVGGTVSKTTLLTGILCLYGAIYKFEYVSPSYTISLLLVCLCAGAVGAFGLTSRHEANRGIYLVLLFFFCSLIQFYIAFVSPNSIDSSI